MNAHGASRQAALAAKASKLFMHRQQHQKATTVERKPRLGRQSGVEEFKTLQNQRPMTADGRYATSGGPRRPAAIGGSLKAFEASRFRKPLNALLANTATITTITSAQRSQKVALATAAAPAKPANSFRIPVKKATDQHKTRKEARPSPRALDLDFQYNTKPSLVRQA